MGTVCVYLEHSEVQSRYMWSQYHVCSLFKGNKRQPDLLGMPVNLGMTCSPLASFIHDNEGEQASTHWCDGS